MDVVKVSTTAISLPELAVLAVLAAICVAAAWVFYQRWSGRTRSDVSGLRFTRRDR
jgi:hypothetical protein